MICTLCTTFFRPNGRIFRKIERLNQKYKDINGKERPNQDSELLCIQCLVKKYMELEKLVKHEIKEEIISEHKYSLVQKDTREYDNILKRTRIAKDKIIRIEKSHNTELLHKYVEIKQRIYGDSYDVSPPSYVFDSKRENYMFHGSTNDTYTNILENGFDKKFAKSTGLLGQGIYFAADFTYSNSYARLIDTDKGQVKCMLMTRVSLGKSDKGSSGAISPPKGCDSASGYGNTYAVFDNHQAYPEYIIYYYI